jgi:SnoaL-like domain
MSLTIDQIAEAFSSHRFAETYPYLSDSIKWNNVGGKEYTGRDVVIDQCKQSASYLATVSTTFTKFKVTQAQACIVVESSAQYKDDEDQPSTVASCDVYQFADGLLVEIASYNIELK